MTSIFDRAFLSWSSSLPQAVLVTGPQRSGTRIAARMVATDLGYAYFDETMINVDNLELAVLAFEQTRVVVHAPALCAESHLLWDRKLVKVDVAVLIVRRALPDIIASCERISWNAHEEIAKYRSRPEFAPYLADGAHVAQWKYDVFHGYQWPLARSLGGPEYLEIAYEDLSAHPLWFPKEDRTDWEWDRTAPGKGGRSEWADTRYRRP